MLPDGSGLDLLEELKAMGKRTNVIILSAKDSLEDKVQGLDLGADDYLPNLFIWPNFMHVSRACCGGISGKESRACALETLRYFPIVSG